MHGESMKAKLVALGSALTVVGQVNVGLDSASWAGLLVPSAAFGCRIRSALSERTPYELQ